MMNSQEENELIRVSERLIAWRAEWLEQIQRWANINREEDPSFTAAIESVPDLLSLCVNLIKDPHLDAASRQALIKVVDYVFDPNDALPQSELGPPGLIDDALHMVDWLDSQLAYYGPQIHNNWTGKGEVLSIIEFILSFKKTYPIPTQEQPTPEQALSEQPAPEQANQNQEDEPK